MKTMTKLSAKKGLQYILINALVISNERNGTKFHNFQKPICHDATIRKPETIFPFHIYERHKIRNREEAIFSMHVVYTIRHLCPPETALVQRYI